MIIKWAKRRGIQITTIFKFLSFTAVFAQSKVHLSDGIDREYTFQNQTSNLLSISAQGFLRTNIDCWVYSTLLNRNQLWMAIQNLQTKFPSKHSSWWRRLEEYEYIRLHSRRLDEGEYILINHTSSKDVFKMSSRRLGQNQYIRLVHTSSRRLQDVFKTSSRRLAKTSSRHLQDVLPRRLQNVFKTSRKYVLKTSSRRFEDVSSS